MRIILISVLFLLYFVAAPFNLASQQKINDTDGITKSRSEIGEGNANFMTPEQDSAISKLLKQVDLKIVNEFNKNPNLKQKMQNELAEILKIADTSKRIERILVYQRKYEKEYFEVLKSANIDLNKLASALTKIVPSVEFKVISNSIIGKTNSNKTKSKPKNPGSCTNSINLLPEYVDYTDLNCMMATMEGANITRNSAEAISFAAILGACPNSAGKRLQKYKVPDNTKKCVWKASGSVDNFAFAIADLGASVVKSSVTIRIVNSSNSEIDEDSYEVWAIAPLLWVSFDSIDSDVNLSLNVRSGDRLSAGFFCFSSTIGMLGGASYGFAKVTNCKSKIGN